MPAVSEQSPNVRLGEVLAKRGGSPLGGSTLKG
jgi:hypothetical protein